MSATVYLHRMAMVLALLVDSYQIDYPHRIARQAHRRFGRRVMRLLNRSNSHTARPPKTFCLAVLTAAYPDKVNHQFKMHPIKRISL
jgi:hypothetical protein